MELKLQSEFHLRDPFPVPTTSISGESNRCIQVYRLGSKALDNIPFDNVFILSTLACSLFIFDGEDEWLGKGQTSIGDSANTDILFPV